MREAMQDKIPLTEQQIQSQASARSFSRGEALYLNGAVTKAVRRGDEITARCQGSAPQPYRVWAYLQAGEIVATDCNCAYDWGGDCKHIVAMLLTYLHHPERFGEGEALRDVLMSREKEDLLDIIEEMIGRYPELEDILEDIVADATVGGASDQLDLQVLRQELKRSLESGWEWMDRVAENKVYELTRRGSRYARRGEYARAIAIYCAILAECNAHEYPTDDEGQYVDAINNTVACLKEAIAQLDFAQHEALRQSVLDTLVDTMIWDIEFGGIDYGHEAEALILQMAQSADISRIREHIVLVANREQAKERFSNWGAEAYESFLMKLDEINSIDPEETLERLQAKELHYLYASKLLDLHRYEEAAEIIGTKCQSSHQLQRGLDLLLSHQQIHTAIHLAKAALGKAYDKRIADWLIDLHRQLGDQETEFRWQLERMQTDPQIDHYIGLRAVSESLENLQTIRPQLIAKLEEKQAYHALTLVYLHDKDWDLAWASLDKVSEPQHHHPSHVNYRLDFAVAEGSRHARPARAIPIYIKYARAEIALGNRKRYAAAAKLLGEVRGMYQQINEPESWNQFIAGLRIEFKQRPALQDELNKGGL